MTGCHALSLESRYYNKGPRFQYRLPTPESRPIDVTLRVDHFLLLGRSSIRSLNPPFGPARLHRACVTHAQERPSERGIERDMERGSVTRGQILVGVCGESAVTAIQT